MSSPTKLVNGERIPLTAKEMVEFESHTTTPGITEFEAEIENPMIKAIVSEIAAWTGRNDAQILDSIKERYKGDK